MQNLENNQDYAVDKNMAYTYNQVSPASEPSHSALIALIKIVKSLFS
jgi:hypothetical protein